MWLQVRELAIKAKCEILPHVLDFSRNILTQYYIFGYHFPEAIKQ